MNGKDQLQFVDTNVLVYAHDAAAGPKRDAAMLLLEELWLTKAGCLSVQVLQELYVTLTQMIAKPFDREDGWAIIATLRRWRIHAPDADDVLDAINLQRRHSLSFWDAMILLSASRLSCATVWSEDLQDGRVYDGILVRNPFA